MAKTQAKITSSIGIVGTLICLVIFIQKPSFPTPDKIVVFLTFIFMIFGQATAMLKKLLPFVAVILVYESFRSIADKLNSHVNYTLAPHIDHALFGNLPTIYLQNWLWRGHVQWYDFLLYIPYMLFFVLPIGLALLIWKTREKYYWQAVCTYITVFFSAFLTFLVFPTAPPWLASQNHYIPPIIRISSNVWSLLGIQDFPSLYNHLAPNPVAAIPSLHAACSTLFAVLIFKLYGRRWGAISLIYPLLIYIGVIYEGEHYAFDVIAGAAYAFAAYFATPYLMRWFYRFGKLYRSKLMSKFRAAYSSSTKNV